MLYGRHDWDARGMWCGRTRDGEEKMHELDNRGSSGWAMLKTVPQLRPRRLVNRVNGRIRLLLSQHTSRYMI